MDSEMTSLSSCEAIAASSLSGMKRPSDNGSDNNTDVITADKNNNSPRDDDTTPPARKTVKIDHAAAASSGTTTPVASSPPCSIPASPPPESEVEEDKTTQEASLKNDDDYESVASSDHDDDDCDKQNCDVNDISPSRSLLPHPYFYYRDHSKDINDEPLTPLSPRVPNFLAKMHTILSDPTLSDIVMWMPHGRSWKVLKPREFEVHVLPVYFEHQKFSSFIRQANGWGFRRMLQGQNRNSYYHEMFLRGMPFLCKKMKRPGVFQKKPVDANHEPDLFMIGDMHPLPQLPINETVTRREDNQSMPPPVTPHALLGHSLAGAKSSLPQTNSTNSNPRGLLSSLSLPTHSSSVTVPNPSLAHQHEIDLLLRENQLLRLSLRNPHPAPSMLLTPGPSPAFVPPLLPHYHPLVTLTQPSDAFLTQRLLAARNMIAPHPHRQAVHTGTSQFAAGFAAAQALNQSQIRSAVRQAFVVANAAAQVREAERVPAIIESNPPETVASDLDILDQLNRYLS